jgi:hypothetical protein
MLECDAGEFTVYDPRHMHGICRRMDRHRVMHLWGRFTATRTQMEYGGTARTTERLVVRRSSQKDVPPGTYVIAPIAK